MRNSILAVVAVFAAVAMATPTADEAPEIGAKTIIVKCGICKGSGKLVLSPPDHGQYRGSIEPKSHWDIRLACPICSGRGRIKAYRTSMPPVKDGTPPCTTCGWTGVEKCRKCTGTGVVRCTAPDCKNGWIITKHSTTTSKHASSAHMKTKVAPCPECKGLGKVSCAECEGLRATVCRKCNGLGKGKEKK